jgi:TIGR03009 family protein
MRHFSLAMIAALIACRVLSAQQPQQAPANSGFDPSKDPLDALLVQWEQKMKGVETLKANLVRTKVDNTFKTTEVFEGQAQYMKPNFASLELKMRGQSTRFEKYISSGTYLYEYNQGTKELRYHELPPPKPGQVADDSFLSFLFGMKADEAKRRYDIKFMGAGQDQNYYYIEIAPRSSADKADFETAQLALSKGTLLPRLLRFKAPNGDVIQWDIPSIESGARLNRQDFEKPQVPFGWKQVRVARQDAGFDPQTNVPPRVVRPQK